MHQVEEDTDAAGGERDTATESSPYDSLWFDDGNIILSTDIHLYRVHKIVLAEHSAVFRDMFQMPSGDANEDVPTVRMAGDSDEEIKVLLLTLYNSKFKQALQDTRAHALSSVLSISSKYNFHVIRTHVLRCLDSLFPTSLEGFLSSRIHELELKNSPKLLFELLAAAHKFEIISIQPVLYYLCARFPLEAIIHLIPTLPIDCMKNLLLGRDWLCALSQHIVEQSLPSYRSGGSPLPISVRVCGVASCMETFRTLVARQFRCGLWRFFFVLDLDERGILRGINLRENGICEGCAANYLSQLDAMKEYAWSRLPQKFCHKLWEQIRLECR
ncbi:hypothetical protein SCHPADRAFT_945471 [Schizopora paradoxa]|uniref:BTB domain-containing protein n=1 Tax=Schizopora paradoxa TaxID=27342 RepID=A0A0H2R784_9AGAM|nr:hypothetical protein SCHPADRAFT_945471 [Schizopora paradoxa]